MCQNKTNDFLENYQCEGETLKIFSYPSICLKKKALPVENFDDELKTLCRNMLYTMYHAPGIGLAAPQVGKSLRFFVIDPDFSREKVTGSDGIERSVLSNFSPQIFVNPKIISLSGETSYEEGCLSLPGIFEDINRASDVVMEYQDIFGNKKIIEATGTTAICLQHEYDHLEGIVFIEHLSFLKKNLIKKKFIKDTKKKKQSENEC